MNQLKVINRENFTTIVVTNFDTDTVIAPNSFALINTNSRFGSDDFYVDGDVEDNWTSKMIDENTMEIFLKAYEYATGKSQYGDTEAW
jgi:hypothetical protein